MGVVVICINMLLQKDNTVHINLFTVILFILYKLHVIISLCISVLLSESKHYVTELSSSPSVSLCVCRSVGRSVRKVYCGKTAEWIRMPFGMVSGVG